MRAGSLFAGVGGFDIGFERAGMSLAWHAEIEPHASAVLRYRWPDVPNLGDVTKIDGAAIQPVDVICGGFPCQDLSVAGKRAGFTGKRSVLAFEFLRIVAEMREATNGRAPTFVVLENVPGLFSSSGGRDFAALLDALGELGPMDVAWRVLDSRYFGVAQRRRRVFVVVDFRGERCDEILTLTEGLRGHPAAGRPARKDVAGTLGDGSSRRGWSDQNIGQPGMLVAHTLRADGFDPSEDGTGRGTPIVAIAFHENQRGEVTTSKTAGALKIGGGKPGQGYPAVAFNWQNGGGYGKAHDGLGVSEDHTPPISRSQVAAVAFTVSAQSNGFAWESPVAPTLGTHPQSDTSQRRTGIRTASGVRRLTPRECERLQGFPDDWTAQGTKPNGTVYALSDGPRYKCMGNAVTVNVAEWIGRKMVAA